MTTPTDSIEPTVFASIIEVAEPLAAALPASGPIPGLRRAAPALRDVAARFNPVYAAARTRASQTARTVGGQLVAGAVRVRPVLVDVRGRSWDTVQVRIVPTVRDARDRLPPVITDVTARGGITARNLGNRAAVSADPIAREAARRGGNILLALRGGNVAPAASPRRTGRRLLAVGVVAGLSYGAWRALIGKPDSLWKTSAVDDRFQHANAARSGFAAADHVELSLVEDLDTTVTAMPVTDPLLPPDLPVIVIGEATLEETMTDHVDQAPPGDPDPEIRLS